MQKALLEPCRAAEVERFSCLRRAGEGGHRRCQQCQQEVDKSRGFGRSEHGPSWGHEVCLLPGEDVGLN